MDVIQLNNYIFIRTPDGCYMVDPTAKSGKAISEDSYNLISDISELKEDVKALAQ